MYPWQCRRGRPGRMHRSSARPDVSRGTRRPSLGSPVPPPNRYQRAVHGTPPARRINSCARNSRAVASRPRHRMHTHVQDYQLHTGGQARELPDVLHHLMLPCPAPEPVPALVGIITHAAEILSRHGAFPVNPGFRAGRVCSRDGTAAALCLRPCLLQWRLPLEAPSPGEPRH